MPFYVGHLAVGASENEAKARRMAVSACNILAEILERNYGYVILKRGDFGVHMTQGGTNDYFYPLTSEFRDDHGKKHNAIISIDLEDPNEMVTNILGNYGLPGNLAGLRKIRYVSRKVGDY